MERWKTLGVLLLAALFSLILWSTAGAYTWHEYNGHWYAWTEISQSWTAARTEAENAGGRLVIINDSEENSWLITTFSDHLSWIGLKWNGEGKYDEKANWRWIDGSTPSFDGWGLNEPNWTVNEEYGAINTGSGSEVFPHGWNNVEDGYGYAGIIECSTNPVPVPSAILLLGTGVLGLMRLRKKLNKYF